MTTDLGAKMRNLLLGGVAAIAITAAFGGAAVAADIPVTKAPVVTKAPPLMDWSGFYAGAHVGWGKARFRGTWLDTSVDEAFGWNTKPSGLLAGVHLGGYRQVNTAVYGLEVDVSGLFDWDKTLIGINPNFPAGGVTTEISLLASLRGVLGVTLNPQTLVYVTGGGAYARAEATAFPPSNSANLNAFGGVVGIGGAWKPNQNWSWRAEGLWYIFDKSENIVVTAVQSTDVKLRDVLVGRVGVTYHYSDRRLKRDVALLALRDDGVGIYRYRYLWSDEVYVGVMAQEVAGIYPDAVVRGPDGYLRVNYGRLGLRFMSWDEWQGLTTELPLAA
jgi:opacity protein-like surface antigen